jgi:hypothetical protein
MNSMATKPRRLLFAALFGVLPATALAIFTAFNDVTQAAVIFLIGLAVSAVIFLVLRRS